MVGKDYLRQLLDFEKAKNQELHNYTKNATINATRIMHERIQALLKWFVKEEKGCIPLTFGEVIDHDMEGEELTFIN